MPSFAGVIAAMPLLSVAAAFQPVVLPAIEKYGVQTVTDQFQVVTLPGCEYATRTNSYSDSYVSTTVAAACPTQYGVVEGWSALVVGSPVVVVERYHVVWEEVYEKVITCPYNELGPNAFPGFQGSGLCETCTGQQTGYVKECSNGNCAAYQCAWGSDMQVHCDNYVKPNGFVPAPAGCETVCASYLECSGSSCLTAQSCYTVPIVGNFPPVYAPGSCQKCLLPPGWTTTVIVVPGSGVTTTVTVPTATATATASATATALSCPADDRQVFVAAGGSTFLVECNVGVNGVEINARDAEPRALFQRAIGNSATFNGCIQLCENISQCNAVSYNPTTDVCRGFAGGVVNANPNGEWVATIIRRAATPNSTLNLSATSSSTLSRSSSTAVASSTSIPAVSTPAVSSSSSSVVVVVSSSSVVVVVPTPSASSGSNVNSSDGPAPTPGAKREELVPKPQFAKKAGTAGRVERRAGRIVSPNVEVEKKDKIRL